MSILFICPPPAPHDAPPAREGFIASAIAPPASQVRERRLPLPGDLLGDLAPSLGILDLATMLAGAVDDRDLRESNKDQSLILVLVGQKFCTQVKSSAHRQIWGLSTPFSRPNQTPARLVNASGRNLEGLQIHADPKRDFEALGAISLVQDANQIESNF